MLQTPALFKYAREQLGDEIELCHDVHERLNPSQVIPTPLHVLGRISPIFSPFFLVFCVHRLDEAVPTSPKPEPRAKRQWQGRPNTVSAA